MGIAHWLELLLVAVFWPLLFLFRVWTPRLWAHSHHQARWMLDLLTIRWKPATDREAQLLDELLAGHFEHETEYLRLQRAAWVEPDDCDRLPLVFQRLKLLRAQMSV